MNRADVVFRCDQAERPGPTLNEKNEFWEFKQLESIYATSVGSLVAAMILLCNDWDVLDDYLTKRPWEKVITVNPIDVINLWQNT